MNDSSYIYSWKQQDQKQDPENRGKFTTDLSLPEEFYKSIVEKQRDLSKRGIRKGQRGGRRKRWRRVMKDWVITPRRE